MDPASCVHAVGGVIVRQCPCGAASTKRSRRGTEPSHVGRAGLVQKHEALAANEAPLLAVADDIGSVLPGGPWALFTTARAGVACRWPSTTPSTWRTPALSRSRAPGLGWRYPPILAHAALPVLRTCAASLIAAGGRVPIRPAIDVKSRLYKSNRLSPAAPLGRIPLVTQELAPSAMVASICISPALSEEPVR